MSHAEPMMSQEVKAVAAGCILLGGYTVLSIFAEGVRQGLFVEFADKTDFFAVLWSVLVAVWINNLSPLFLVLDAFVLCFFLVALIKVQPLKQNMKLLTLKPHAHGHGDHGGGHGDVHGGTGAHHTSAPVKPAGNPATLKHWASIVHRANTGTPENLRWAVMEADALVDHVLRQRGIAGESMAERLQNARWAGSQLVDKVFDAHRLRNELAHTPGFQMTTKQAERALFTFRDFLKELKEF